MNTIATYSNQPWNKGKLVGQKAPLRLKDIWAIRERLQIWHSLNESYEGITDLSQDEEPEGGSTAARPYEACEHRSISRD